MRINANDVALPRRAIIACPRQMASATSSGLVAITAAASSMRSSTGMR
jgi:hypothetical protein